MTRKEIMLEHYNRTHKIINDIIYKECGICKEWSIEEENFYYQYEKSGANCKKCSKEKAMKWKHDPKNRASLTASNKKSDLAPERHKKTKEYMKIRRFNGEYKKWQQNNPEKIKQYRLDREQNKTHTISKKEWKLCQEYFNNQCAYCGLPIEEHFTTYRGITKQGNFHKEHVDYEGVNDLSNCVPACKSCNCQKNVFSLDEWYNDNKIEFSQERLNKIHKWLEGDYKRYTLPYIIKKIKNIDTDKYNFELWSKDDNNQPKECLAVKLKKKDLDKYIENILYAISIHSIQWV